MKFMQTSSQALNHVCLLIIVFFLKNLDAASNETLSPTPSPTTASLEESQNWDVLRTSLIIYLPSFVVVILIFCYARLKFPAVYNVRNTVESIKNPLASTPYGFFSWMWNVMYVSEADIFDTCGMDALCLLRITRMGTYLSCISIFCSIFLIPVYEYAQSSSEPTDKWVQTTTTSLPEASNSFTATVVGAYIIFGSTTYLITKEFQWFVVAREKFLSLRVARSYTVYVSGLPRAYRSNAALAQFFRRIFADDVVHSASVAMHLPKLTAAVYRQMTLEQNLERAKMLRSLDHGKEPMQTLLNPTKKDIVERVPAIPYYTQQLAKVHEDIYELKAIIEKRQELSNSGQYTSSFSQSKSQENGEVRQNSSKNGKLVSAASIAIGALSDLNDEGGKLGRQERDNRGSEIFVEPDDCEVNERDSDNFDSFFCARESLDGSNEENVEGESGDTSGQDVANTTPSICNGLQYAATVSEHVSEAGSRGITKVVSIIATAIGHGGSDEGKPLDAGFVTFTKLSAASFALQTVHSSVPFQMDVVESPSPEQVLWNNVGLTNRSVQPRRLFVFVITTLLCIFWTVPVALLVSLTEVKVLKEKLPFLDEWLEAAPWLEQVLSQISPLLLSFLNSVVVPMLMRQISAYEGVLGLSHLEASLFTKLAAFSLFQTFFVASLAGGVTSAISKVDQVGDVFRYLAKTIPPQSIYFMQLILIQTVIGLGCELLRTTALLQALLRSHLGPRVTEKERSLPFIGLRPLCNPRYFLHAQVLAGTTLRFMVLFSFAVLSPFVSYVLCFSFVMLEVGFRHQFIYIYPSTLDSGGHLWLMFTTIILVCMSVAQLILLTYLALAKARTQLFMMCPLVIGTGLFLMYLRQRHFRVARYLASVTCDEVDTRNNFNKCAYDELDFLQDQYLQPALSAMKKITKDQSSLDSELYDVHDSTHK